MVSITTWRGDDRIMLQWTCATTIQRPRTAV